MTIEDESTIDFVAHDPERDEVVLIMVQEQDWGDRGHQLPALQAKVNTYLAFALDGQLAAEYPAYAGKPVHIQLRSTTRPGERELTFLRIVSERWLEPSGIRLSWRVIGEPGENGA